MTLQVSNINTAQRASVAINPAGIFVALLMVSVIAVGQSPAPDPPSCIKTISFAAAEGGQPVPAIPKFAAKWIGKTKHIEGYPEMCLSQIPSSRTANYVVIFATSESSFDGLTPTAHTYTSTTPLVSGSPGPVSYGGTWSYSYTGRLPLPTTSSLDLLRIDDSKKTLVLRAYNQQGRLLSHYNVDADHNREKLLETVLGDIHRDVPERVDQKHVAAPLSVYYVNCDVDSPGPSSMVAANASPPSHADPKPAPPPAPPSLPALQFWSDPAGADIFVDGGYLGRTPFTSNVRPGEHVVMMQKVEYGVWQRKIQVTAGERKVGAILERKFLNLAPGGQ